MRAPIMTGLSSATILVEEILSHLNHGVSLSGGSFKGALFKMNLPLL